MNERPSKGHQGLRAGRWSIAQQVYLVTTTTRYRTRWFHHWLVAGPVCAGIRSNLRDATALCWVLMPDHLHVLVDLGEQPLHRVIGQLKSRTGKIANQRLRRTGPVWAPPYHDHALRRDEDLVAIARYVVANPLRAGLVRSLGDYPYWDSVWL